MTPSRAEYTETHGGTADLSESERHRLLAAEQRRATLAVLADLTAPVDLMDLAALVAIEEADGTEPEEATVEQVAIRLHHSHLPLMDELGVLDYDPLASRIESGPDRIE